MTLNKLDQFSNLRKRLADQFCHTTALAVMDRSVELFGEMLQALRPDYAGDTDQNMGLLTDQPIIF